MDVRRDRGSEARVRATRPLDSRTLLPAADPTLPGPPADHVVGLVGFTDVVAVSARAASQLFRAREPGGDRPVAVKIYTSAVLADAGRAPRDRAALERRIGAAQQLGAHPNLVDVQRFGVVPTGQPFVVMPWYDHGSVADELWRRGPLPLPEVLRIGAGVAAGLGYAHGFGFVHRVVKPTNVLVSLIGEPVLSDFAVDAGDDGAERQSPHAAPELWDGRPATAASDVWSLAATLYTALAGRPPFGPGSPPRLGDIPLPPLPRLDVPRALTAVLEAALSRRPEDRPAAPEIADHLAWIGRQHGADVGDGEGPGVGADTNPRGGNLPTPRSADPVPVAETAQPPQPSSPVTAVDGTADQGAAERTAVEGTTKGSGGTTGSSALEGTPAAPPPPPTTWPSATAEPPVAPEVPARVTEQPRVAEPPKLSAQPPRVSAVPAGGAADPVRVTADLLGITTQSRRVSAEPRIRLAARSDRPAPGPRPARPAPVRPVRPVGGRRERWIVEVKGTGGVLGVLAATVIAIAVVASAATYVAGRSQPAPTPTATTRSSTTAAAASPSSTRIPAARAAAPKAPLAAEAVRVITAARSSVTLAWRDPNGGRLPYVVLTDAGAATVAPQRARTATSHVVTGLAPATTYCFTVATGTGAVTPVTMPTCARTLP